MAVFVNVFLVSFIAAATFGITFNIPKTTVIPCGFVGMIGWVLYIGLFNGAHLNEVFSTFIASFVIAVISQFLARFYKNPVIVFNVSGIIPLVPGGLAYNTMRYFVESNYMDAMASASKVLLIAGAIAFGLVLAGIIPEILRRFRTRPTP